MAQRLQVAEMLEAGFTYSDIEIKIGAKTATISGLERFYTTAPRLRKRF